MKLIIMRHGEAVPLIQSDADRVLTLNGQKQVNKIAAMIQQEYSVSHVLHSPYVRAQETAALIASCYACPFNVMENITPSSEPQHAYFSLLGMIENIETEQNTVLLVSHMPFVGLFSQFMCDNHAGALHNFNLAEAVLLVGDVLCLGKMQFIKRFNFAG